jgi:MFS transporter, BCD family, chlorophyll transporter
MRRWAALGPSFFPFADVATPDLSLGRLIRLSLFQVSVGMALVLLVGTLNRVMIVELGVPASIVGLMIALPIVFAPFRALIGFRSDTHRSALGWRRVPFIWRGSLTQFAGFAVMPFALLVLAGQGEAASAPAWVGISAAALSFLLVGAGLHTVQTAGLALATDLTPEESHPRVVGLMYVTLLLGMIVSSLLFGALLVNFSPGRLVQVIQGAAVATLIINVVAIWKQETRNPLRGAPDPSPDPSFREAWSHFASGPHAVHHLVIVGLGTMAFGMADVLLEPFGGQVLGMSVSSTTLLTALFASGGLVGFALASHLLGRGGDAIGWTRNASVLGIPAFLAVLVAGPVDLLPLFLVGNFLIGVGAAVFSHSTLTATMNRAPKDQIGLALGSWGAVQATAAGLAIALSGAVRDGVGLLLRNRVSVAGMDPVATGYLAVFGLEIVFLIVTILATVPLLRARRSALAAKRS